MSAEARSVSTANRRSPPDFIVISASGGSPRPSFASQPGSSTASSTDTWTARTPVGLCDAATARTQFVRDILPSYPNVKAAFLRANTFGEDTIR